MNAVISQTSATPNPLHTNYLEQAADSSFRSYDYRDYRLRLGQFKFKIQIKLNSSYHWQWLREKAPVVVEGMLQGSWTRVSTQWVHFSSTISSWSKKTRRWYATFVKPRLRLRLESHRGWRMRLTARMFYFCLHQLIHESIGFCLILTDLDIIVIFNMREISYW